MVDFHNEEIVRTSIPFRYEPFTQPKLKELRARYRLDDVVSGAKTDLDIITKLAAWSVAPMEMGGVAPGRILSSVGRARNPEKSP